MRLGERRVMRRDTVIQLIAAACMVVLLGASAVLALQISASTGKNRLVYADKAEAGDPPQVALGIAMGAFRGLFVNYLWMRANNLKEEGKYYEAIDLSKTITRLQPRFPKVWQFHAWNLAYNISVATQTPQERWQWVQAGIRLLRREGIAACPNDLGIHKELAWILLHKVQGYMDDAHKYYKTEFAIEWTQVLGSPPVMKFEDRVAGNLKDEYINRWIRPIADAPNSLEELYEKHPKAEQLVAAIKSRAGLDLDRRLLDVHADLEALIAAGVNTGVISPALANDPLAAIMMDPAFPPEVGKAVMNYTRKKVLRDDFNMEPSRMIRYMEKYGPLDWRHPAAHAIYWSARGVEEALGRMNEANRKDFDIVNTDRITIQAVQELFRTGTLYFDILNPNFYMALPNTDYIDVYGNVLGELEKRSDFDDPTRPWRFYTAGYENHLKDTIRYLYRRGDIAAARRYQEKLISLPSQNVHDPIRRAEELAKPLEQWVLDEIVKENRETSPVVALQEVAGALQSAFVNGLLMGDTKRFTKEFDYARLFHKQYQDTQHFRTWVAGEQGRLGFPEFDVLAGQLFAGLIEAAGVPAGPTMFRRAPADLQARAYVSLERSAMRLRMDQDAKQGAPGFEVWFPEPKGVGLYRMQLEGAGDGPPKGKAEAK